MPDLDDPAAGGGEQAMPETAEESLLDAVNEAAKNLKVAELVAAAEPESKLKEQQAAEETREKADVVREAIGLQKQIEAIKLELAPLEKRLKELQPKMVSAFEESGDQRRTTDGKTAYLRRELWVYPAKGAPKGEVAEALRKAQLADFIKESFNISSISAYAREIEKEEGGTDGLLENAKHPFLLRHPGLEGFLEPTEKFSVRIVAAG